MNISHSLFFFVMCAQDMTSLQSLAEVSVIKQEFAKASAKESAEESAKASEQAVVDSVRRQLAMRLLPTYHPTSILAWMPLPDVPPLDWAPPALVRPIVESDQVLAPEDSVPKKVPLTRRPFSAKEQTHVLEVRTLSFLFVFFSIPTLTHSGGEEREVYSWDRFPGPCQISLWILGRRA